MNRREFVTGAVALGLMPHAFFGKQALAAESSPLQTISDGSLQLPLDLLLPNGLPDAMPGMGLQEVAAQGTLDIPCNITAFRRPEGLIVFDTGSGPNFMPSAGALYDNFLDAGLDPAEVTDVVFTHAHPDHLWGVVDGFDELFFPEANYHMAETEWDFWASDGAMEAVGAERQSFVVGARNRFEAIEDRISFFKPGDVIVSGIEVIGAKGHTPGHSAFVVEGDEPTMIVGDAIANDPISFERPDLAWGADMDTDQGAKTRTMLLDRLASDKMRFIGFHLPDGGIGRVERKGQAFAFVPANA